MSYDEEAVKYAVEVLTRIETGYTWADGDRLSRRLMMEEARDALVRLGERCPCPANAPCRRNA